MVCSRIIFPNLNEGTISNAEVTDCDKNVLCRERHERVAIMYRCGASVPSASASPPWLGLSFVSSKQKKGKRQTYSG